MARPRVLVTSELPGDAVELLSRKVDVDFNHHNSLLKGDKFVERLALCDALVCILSDQLTEEVIAACPKLKLIANVAVGYDNIDVAAASRHQILVTNTPGVLDETTADLAFALLMAVSRRIVEADKYVRDGQWKSWQFNLLPGHDVYGKTLGIIGFGRIGQAVARRAAGFGMPVIYTRRQSFDPSAPKHPTANLRQVTMDELLSSSDFISIHCPLNAETRHLIGRTQLAAMKPGCILINTARGAIIDEQALLEVLQKGELRGAGLDVFEHEPQVPGELMAMNNVVLVPHIGSASIETRCAMARLAVNGLLTAFLGTLPDNAVNKEIWPTFLERTEEQGDGSVLKLCT